MKQPRVLPKMMRNEKDWNKQKKKQDIGKNTLKPSTPKLTNGSNANSPVARKKIRSTLVAAFLLDRMV